MASPQLRHYRGICQSLSRAMTCPTQAPDPAVRPVVVSTGRAPGSERYAGGVAVAGVVGGCWLHDRHGSRVPRHHHKYQR
jgi:hypothetical protein